MSVRDGGPSRSQMTRTFGSAHRKAFWPSVHRINPILRWIDRLREKTAVFPNPARY